MIGNLSVIWDYKHDGIPNKVANGIRKIVEDKLGEHEFMGIWQISSLEKTGSNISNGFKAKRLAQHGVRWCIKAQVMPGNRDTSWEIGIVPPEDYNERDVFAVIAEKKSQPKEQERKQAKPVIPDSISQGSIYTGVVKRVLEYGIEVHIDLGAVGFCPLEALSKEFDKNVLKNYKPGNKIRVMVTEIDKGKNTIKLSKNMVDLNNPKATDSFTGLPDQNGHLSLNDYSKNPLRLYFVLECIAEAVKDNDGTYAPKDYALELITSSLCHKYNAKSVGRLFPVIRALESEPVSANQVDKLINYVENEGQIIGYELTDRGWAEVGGRRKFGISDPEPIGDDEFDLDSIDDGSIKISRPITRKPSVKLEQPESKSKPKREEPKPEPESKPELDIDLLEEYIRKMQRLARMLSILSSVKDLEREKSEIMSWMTEQPDQIKRQASITSEIIGRLDVDS